MNCGARFNVFKKFGILLFVIFTILAPRTAFAEGIDTILIVVDEMSIDRVEDISIDRYAIGLMNLKTRPPNLEKNLYLSINAGKKLGSKELKIQGNNLEYLGDKLKKEKLSYIGDPSKRFIISDKDGNVDYKEDSLEYNLDWLISKTDEMLDKSNILEISYDFKDDENRIDIFKRYLEHYKKDQIIILPKALAKEDKYLLNRNLVPIIYINGEDKGVLTSLSTKREGYVALEDISVQLKSTYGFSQKTDIGNTFKIINEDNPVKVISKIYKETMNLFIITYIFHGLLYLSQLYFAIYILKHKNKKENPWILFIYCFISIVIIMSLILGMFSVHRNIGLYLILITFISYFLTKFIISKEKDLVKKVSITTYTLIILGIIFYPKMIYNSYIGFNNLVYGARYYGLNNGIMGVLLISSILSFFSISKTIKNKNTKVLVGIIIFSLNMLALSTNFGANTGGFITSVALFIMMMYALLFSERYNIKIMLLFFLGGIILFGINMIFDNNSGDKSHAIEFFYRLKNNGFKEFIVMSSFKARELLTLTILPPFSIVLISQGVILNKLKELFIINKKIKKEAMIVIITSLIGFIINDTGVIMFIYIMHYFILSTIIYKNDCI